MRRPRTTPLPTFHILLCSHFTSFFFFNDTATTEIYTLSLHDALPILEHEDNANTMGKIAGQNMAGRATPYTHLPFFYSDLFELGYEAVGGSEEHTSELQSLTNLVCRLLLEKKKTKHN